MNAVSICNSIIQQLHSLLEAPLFRAAYCRQNSFTRKRKLDFRQLVYFLLDSSPRPLFINMARFRDRYPGLDFPDITKQAVSKARQNIHPQAFAEMCRLSASVFCREQTRPRRWHGYRVLSIDGTKLQVPQTGRSKSFFGAAGNQNKGAACAMASASMLYDVLNDVILDARIGKLCHKERDYARQHILELECLGRDPSTIVLFDRGYPGYKMYRFLEGRGLYFLFRLSGKHKTLVELEGEDNVVLYEPRGADDGPVRLRVIKVSLGNGVTETLVTNIFDEAFTPELFKELYFLRWGIEGKYRELKEQLQLEEFSGSHPLSVCQDFYICIFLSNLTAILKQAADEEVRKRAADRKGYQANRSFLLNRVKSAVVRLAAWPGKAEALLSGIVESAKKVRSQIRPDRKFERTRKQSRRKHHCNRKCCL